MKISINYLSKAVKLNSLSKREGDLQESTDTALPLGVTTKHRLISAHSRRRDAAQLS